MPIVVIPGVQGRWEWMKPGIDALAQRSRVITFSLADEPSAKARFDQAAGFSNYVDQVRDALDSLRLERAAICGVSYGGLIAAAFAARYPARVSSLILASAPPPSWRPDERVSFYVRHPWMMTPLFSAGSLRFYPEIAASQDSWWSAFTTAGKAALNVLGHMFHPGRMARRVHLLNSAGAVPTGVDASGVEGPAPSGVEGRIEAELARVKVPTLLVTGEDRLECVMPPRLTKEYLAIWPHARVETLARTGHLGLITRPQDFAALVSKFVSDSVRRIA